MAITRCCIANLPKPKCILFQSKIKLLMRWSDKNEYFKTSTKLLMVIFKQGDPIPTSKLDRIFILCFKYIKKFAMWPLLGAASSTCQNLRVFYFKLRWNLWWTEAIKMNPLWFDKLTEKEISFFLIKTRIRFGKCKMLRIRKILKNKNFYFRKKNLSAGLFLIFETFLLGI